MIKRTVRFILSVFINRFDSSLSGSLNDIVEYVTDNSSYHFAEWGLVGGVAPNVPSEATDNALVAVLINPGVGEGWRRMLQLLDSCV